MSQPPSKTVQRACRVLRRQVRYKSASLRLPGTDFPHEDTADIRTATALYVESWIIPILNAIERGDTRLLARLIDSERGDKLNEAS